MPNDAHPGTKPVEMQLVDFHDRHQLQTVVTMLDYYAQSPSGGNRPLPQTVKDKLAKDLPRLPGALSLLAWQGDEPIGLLNAFSGYSTFAASPLLNIHDLVVHENHRNQGIARQLLQAAEDQARERGCCKLTLEVLSENHAAKASYRRFGFAPYDLGEEYGSARFWQKPL